MTVDEDTFGIVLGYAFGEHRADAVNDAPTVEVCAINGKYGRGTSAFNDRTNIGRDGKTETSSAKRLRPYAFSDALAKKE